MLNMDFAQSVVIDTAVMAWVSSPQPGVLRKPLARQDQESGHATSIVKYAAGAKFPTHLHPAGEEILVLSGIFSDESGDYPAGSYLRNPPGSSHAPFSKEGCELFVKLCQFLPGDTKQFSIATSDLFTDVPAGRNQLNLHSFAEEAVFMLSLPEGESLESDPTVSGQEMLVLSGSLRGPADQTYSKGCWVRAPQTTAVAALEPSLIWVKRGHLPR